MSETTSPAGGATSTTTAMPVPIGPYTCHICFKEYNNGHQLGGHRKAHRPRQPPVGGPIKRNSKKSPAARPQPVPTAPAVKEKKASGSAPPARVKKPPAATHQAAPQVPAGPKEDNHRSPAVVAAPVVLVTGRDRRCGPSAVMARAGEEEEVTSKVCLELSLWWD